MWMTSRRFDSGFRMRSGMTIVFVEFGFHMSILAIRTEDGNQGDMECSGKDMEGGDGIEMVSDRDCSSPTFSPIFHLLISTSSRVFQYTLVSPIRRRPATDQCRTGLQSLVDRYQMRSPLCFPAPAHLSYRTVDPPLTLEKHSSQRYMSSSRADDIRRPSHCEADFKSKSKPRRGCAGWMSENIASDNLVPSLVIQAFATGYVSPAPCHRN
jgi:hypothetical protein